MNDVIYTPRAKRFLNASAECSKCHVVKPPYEFHTTKYATLNSWCKDCTKKKAKEYYRDYMSKAAREKA